VPDRAPESDELLALSQSILAAAKAMKWEEVERLERERGPVMEKLFSSSSRRESDIAFLVRVIEEVQTIDRQVVSLIEAERNRVVQDLRMLRNSRQGDQAYRSVENE